MKICWVASLVGLKHHDELNWLARLSVAMRFRTSLKFAAFVNDDVRDAGAMYAAIMMSRVTSTFPLPGAPLTPSSKTVGTGTVSNPAFAKLAYIHGVKSVKFEQPDGLACAIQGHRWSVGVLKSLPVKRPPGPDPVAWQSRRARGRDLRSMGRGTTKLSSPVIFRIVTLVSSEGSRSGAKNLPRVGAANTSCSRETRSRSPPPFR